MNQFIVPVSPASEVTEKLTPFEIAETYGFNAVLSALVRVRKMRDPVVAQVVLVTTGVVALRVSVPEQAEPAVASCIAIVLPEAEAAKSPDVARIDHLSVLASLKNKL